MFQIFRKLNPIQCRAIHPTSVKTRFIHLNFFDSKSIYQFKTTWELCRSLAILKICSINFFADNSLKMMKVGHRVLGDRLFSHVVRPTFYRQFVGGDTETELMNTADTLKKSNLRLMVCPVQEEDVGEGTDSEDKYETNKDYIIDTARIMAKSGLKTPNLQLKITAFMSADLVANLSQHLIDEKVTMEEIVSILSQQFLGIHSDVKLLSDIENGQLARGILRIQELVKFALEKDLRILVDGEYTYMNPGISALALAMMLAFNKQQPLIGNTYQCYLKDALQTIKRQKALVDKYNCHFAAKIVRGAYMEKEKKLAKAGGYPDPINESYEKTGEMYNKVIQYLLDESKRGKDMYVVVATHNESSVNIAVDAMLKRNILPTDGAFVFGQIYGMGEQLSMPLANSGFVVYKSVPYGPLDEVLPYLSRRATENRAVMLGARRERTLLLAELKRRLKSTFSST